MKRLLLALLVLRVPAVLVAQAKQVLLIDPRASTLTWTGHAEVGTYAPSGGLSLRQGQMVFEGGALEQADFVVDMKSMTQSNPDLLHHLKSPGFFEVERYPTALITVQHVEHGMASGTITIRNKTTPFRSPVRVLASGDRFSIEGKVTLDRTRYGVTYNSPSFFSSLGDKAIRNTFDVEFRVTGRGTILKIYLSETTSE